MYQVQLGAQLIAGQASVIVNYTFINILFFLFWICWNNQEGDIEHFVHFHEFSLLLMHWYIE